VPCTVDCLIGVAVESLEYILLLTECEKRVGDASAFLTAYFGLWHRMGLAEEHQVHMRDSQRHHAPAVG